MVLFASCGSLIPRIGGAKPTFNPMRLHSERSIDSTIHRYLWHQQLDAVTFSPTFFRVTTDSLRALVGWDSTVDGEKATVDALLSAMDNVRLIGVLDSTRTAVVGYADAMETNDSLWAKIERDERSKVGGPDFKTK